MRDKGEGREAYIRPQELGGWLIMIKVDDYQNRSLRQPLPAATATNISGYKISIFGSEMKHA